MACGVLRKEGERLILKGWSRGTGGKRKKIERGVAVRGMSHGGDGSVPSFSSALLVTDHQRYTSTPIPPRLPQHIVNAQHQPHSPFDTGDASSEVNKIRYTERVGCLPDRLLVSALEVDSGSARRESESALFA